MTLAPESLRPLAGGLVTAAFLLLSPPAAGQAPPRAGDAATAKALFDHGLDEMKQGHYPEGCGALAESYKLNPQAGALFTLAECEAKRGRIATAIQRYEEYVAVFVKLSRDKQARQHGRDVLSKDQIGILSAKVPRVTLLLGTAAGAEVTIDGVVVDHAALAGPIPVDPGDHVVFAHASGGSPVEQRFSIAVAEQKTVSLSIEPKAPPPPPPDPSPSGLRVAGFVAGGVGVVLLGVGAITGGLALGDKGTIQHDCKLNASTGIASCNQAGLAAGNDVTRLGAASTGTFIVGAAALAAGVGLLIAAPSTPKPGDKTGRRAPGPSGLRVGVLSASPRGALLGMEGAW